MRRGHEWEEGGVDQSNSEMCSGRKEAVDESSAWSITSRICGSCHFSAEKEEGGGVEEGTYKDLEGYMSGLQEAQRAQGRLIYSACFPLCTFQDPAWDVFMVRARILQMHFVTLLGGINEVPG